MMDRRKSVMNRGEVIAEEAIMEAAARFGAQVRAKLKLSDVLEIRSSGLSKEEFDYATKAHLDFVVLNDQHVAEFAIELDGRHHFNDPTTIRRDQMKNSICERLGLFLLRVDSDFLKSEGRFTLLGWLIEIWFMQEAFYEQIGDHVPEPFIYFNVFEVDPNGGLRAPYALDDDALRSIARAVNGGKLSQTYPEVLTPPLDSEPEFVTAYAVLSLNSGGHVVGKAQVRRFQSFGVGPDELACDLAVADAGRKLDAVLAGEREPVGLRQMRRLRQATRGWTLQGQQATKVDV